MYWDVTWNTSNGTLPGHSFIVGLDRQEVGTAVDSWAQRIRATSGVQSVSLRGRDLHTVYLVMGLQPQLRRDKDAIGRLLNALGKTLGGHAACYKVLHPGVREYCYQGQLLDMM